jgi:ABC-2 type transport system ATP-binding protein
MKDGRFEPGHTPPPARSRRSLAALERAEIAVTSATVSRPSLDDVYLHYAGHSFEGTDR